MLNAHAYALSDSIKANVTREEWTQAKILMRFGGRPPRCATEHPYLEDDDGKPIEDQDQQAEAELTHFAKAERSIFRAAQDICDSYTDRAIAASTLRALQDTPLENL